MASNLPTCPECGSGDTIYGVLIAKCSEKISGSSACWNDPVYGPVEQHEVAFPDSLNDCNEVLNALDDVLAAYQQAGVPVYKTTLVCLPAFTAFNPCAPGEIFDLSTETCHAIIPLPIVCPPCFEYDVAGERCVYVCGPHPPPPPGDPPLPFVAEGIGFHRLPFRPSYPVPRRAATKALDPTPRGNPAPFRATPLTCAACDGDLEEFEMNPAPTAQTNTIKPNPQIGGNVGTGIPPPPRPNPTMTGIPKPNVQVFS